MRPIKIAQNNFIVDATTASKIEKIKEKVDKKLIRFYKNNQINEEEMYGVDVQINYIDPNSNNFNERIKSIINKNNNHFFEVIVRGADINYDDWLILGSLDILEDSNDFILNSLSHYDLPDKYRNIEDPSNCDHCSQNRRRKKTFIIQNENTKEVLQIGSSCMDEYIKENHLKSLLKYSDLVKSINEVLYEKSNIEIEEVLVNKNIFLGLVDFFAKEDFKNYLTEHGFLALNTKENFSLNKAFSAALIFTFDLNKEKEKIFQEGFLENFEINKEIFENGKEISRFYHNLGEGSLKYNDNISNIQRLIQSDIDFLNEKEILFLKDAIHFKNLYEKKSNDISQYFSNFVDYISIGEKQIYNERVNNLDKILSSYIAFDLFKKKDISFNKDIENLEVNKKVDLLLNKNNKDYYLQAMLKCASDTDLKEIKENFNEEYNGLFNQNKNEIEKIKKDFIEFIKNNKFNDYLLNYKKSEEIINKIKKDKEILYFSELEYFHYVFRDFEKFKELDRKHNSKVSKDYIGAEKERIEEIYIKPQKKITFDTHFGYKSLYFCEDLIGNSVVLNFTGSIPKELQGNGYDTDWLKVSGTIKEHKLYNKNGFEEKQTHLNRVKILNSLEEKPEFNQIKIKGKQIETQSFKVSHIEKDEENNLYKYTLKDKDDIEYKMTSNREVDFSKPIDFIKSEKDTIYLSKKKKNKNKIKV